MRLVFMGTPAFAVPSLVEIVSAGHEVVCVYSQPPRPRGRGQQLRPSPVQELAESLGIEVRTPATLAGEAEAIEALDLDALIVVAYGQILKPRVLDAARLGAYNLHASLLPRWRGAAPIQRAIMAGDTETGVQIMRMSEGLDEGPVLLSERLAIGPEDTASTLGEALSTLGASLWPRALGALERGGANFVEQVGESTYARKISAAEARIDWTRPARQVDGHIRGLSSVPGAYFMHEGVRIKVLMSACEPDHDLADGAQEGKAQPGTVQGGTVQGGTVEAGTVLAANEGGVVVACADGAVRLTRLQREGRAVQSSADFLRGYPLAAGAVLG
ncbi:MAG: methionyl-tRNA formyltransferase [Brevundimonas sp.]|uniref:methionyl-tRNA formyltransferase n=1 Tax=Brevundimonas sp. TaxID=1871086 RepID=UPI00391A4CA8